MKLFSITATFDNGSSGCGMVKIAPSASQAEDRYKEQFPAAVSVRADEITPKNAWELMINLNTYGLYREFVGSEHPMENEIICLAKQAEKLLDVAKSLFVGGLKK